MWPPEQLASKLYDIANWGLILSLILGVISTAMLVRMGNIKEEYLRRDLGATTERAAHANERASLAAEDAGKANERAALLEVEALKLRRKLALQGSREALLSGDDRRKLVNELSPFARQKIDVRYSASAMMINSEVVNATPLGDDTLGLANALVGILQDAGWSLPPKALLYGVQGYGINIEIIEGASPSTKNAADALAKALRSASLAISGPSVISKDRARRVGTAAQAMAPLLDENTIVLGVLTHPN